MAQELKQVFEGAKLTYIREQTGDTIFYRFSGPFQEMNDIRKNTNKNGRIYTKALWEKVFSDTGMLERLASKRMLGECDHPLDEGQIRRTSHIVTELTPDFENGLINGKLELLNHNQGDAALLRALVEQGTQICVSSRGFGDFLKDGCTIDPESYKLVTFDVVLDPSVSIAKLNQVAEKVNESLAVESKAHLFKEATQKIEKESTHNNLKENEEMEKLIEQMELNSALGIKLAKNEVHLENMQTVVKAKNEQIEKLENANRKAIEESATAIKVANEKVAALEATITEYNGIEEKAIKVIEGLKAKVEQYETLGEKAADTIEELSARLRKREAGEDDLKKADKADPVKGPIRKWEPDSDKGGDDPLKTAKSEKKMRKEEDDKDMDKDADKKDEDADKKDGDETKAERKARHEAEDKEGDKKDEKKRKEEADEKDMDKDAEKKEAEEKDGDEKKDEKKKKEEDDDEDDDDAEEKPFNADENRKFMRNSLKEALIRDGAPKKL